MADILFHSCSGSCSEDCRETIQSAINQRDKECRVIDFHCHIFVPAVEKLVEGRAEKIAEVQALADSMGPESNEHNATVMLPFAGPRLVNLQQRFSDMEAMGVDMQVISPSPTQYYYWADETLAREIVNLQNQSIAEICSQNATRLMGLGNVSLQHPELAVEQLKSCMNLGLKGVEISTFINGVDLSSERFEDFWKTAEALGSVIFIHPFGASLGQRLEPFYLSNLIGQPLETTIALSHLIFSGVLDRYPNLKLLAAHGGGYLPTYIQRSDHGYRVRPECQRISKKPSEYLSQIWFDSLVYDKAALSRLINQVGISQVVVGSDYPFDMGSYDIHALLASLDLTKDEYEKLLSGNALKLLS